MPAIIICAACQTKLKIPDNSTAKALRCPKCKGIVPLAATAPAAPPPPEPAPKANEEEEFEVNEAADEKEEEFEVNAAADEDEELEVNEAADEEEDEADEEADDEATELLVELGFPKGKDPFKIAKIPADVRKAFEKSFIKKERGLWAGRPSAKIIESKAWIGLAVGGGGIVVGLTVCLGAAGASFVVNQGTMATIAMIGLGSFVGLVFAAIGLLAIVFRKNIGGNVKACYVLTNKRAYICDGAAGGGTVRAFTPAQLLKMRIEESSKFEGDGDLIFAYDVMGNEGVSAHKEELDRLKGSGHNVASQSTAVGFLNIEKVTLVKKMVNEVLVAPAVDKAEAKAKAKAKRKKARAKERSKPTRPFGNS
jgi:hypothetical protein